jgi:hypothetical protein
VVGEIVRESFEGIPKAALDEGETVLIDLTRCRYIDSGGLAVLFSGRRKLAPGGWLGIIGTDTNILRLLEIVGLTSGPGVRLFNDYPNMRETLQVRAG